MYGPGEYAADVPEGITHIEDLPKPRIERCSRNYLARACPRCGCRAGRYAVTTRTLHDLGDARVEQPIDLLITFSRHRCLGCGCCFACELCVMACATLAGCEMCLKAHEEALRKQGLTEAQVHDSVRLAAVVAGATTALEFADPVAAK